MVPIHTKTAYSLLQSPMMPASLVQAAKERGYQAVALTDENVLYGMDSFYRAARENDLQPLLGLTFDIVGILQSAQHFPLLVLVENQNGYENLLKLSSRIQTKNEPLTIEELANYLPGLFMIFPAMSEFHYLLSIEPSQAQALLDVLPQYVDLNHVLLGVTLGMEEHNLSAIRELAEKFKIRYVATDPVSYLNPADSFAATVLQYMKKGETITNLGEIRRNPADEYLQGREQIETAYQRLALAPAVENTDWLAAQSHFEISKTQVTLPAFKTPQGQSSINYLQELAKNGLAARLQSLTNPEIEVYQARLADELAAIEKMGFADYFLIVWDALNFAHKNNIRTGAGRGSAAGSLVAYVLWITDVDPIKYDLLFERFLNPSRAQMPDIDIDVPDNRREDILNYLHEHYGHERFGQIITFATLGNKAVVRDVARVFGLTVQQIDSLARVVPNDQTLDLAVQSNQKLQNVLLDLPIDTELFVATVKQLTGLPRNKSLHAAGVVLSAHPLEETVPVELNEDQRLVTQLTKEPVEALGLLKIDFLGLSNLAVLEIALNEVAKDPQANFDINRIDLNDTKTLAVFQNGATDGIFQFESAGMKQMLKQLQPDRFEDIVAANALFRPGPSQNIGHFIARKHGKEAQTIPDGNLRDILAPTYGIIVYQEQVMRVAERFAAFTLADADLLRRAMSKKDGQKLTKLKEQFISGAQRTGHSSKVAEEVYGYIETFAQYGFNRSHAVAYAKLAFQLAYLKAHFPSAFYKAVLNKSWSDKHKAQVYIAEARATGVIILGPNINKSWQGFSVEQGQLQIGLGSIAGLRSDLRNEILEQRRLNGPFKDMTNFIGRLSNKYRKFDLLEPLIFAGALDTFGPNRRSIYASLKGFIEAVGLAGESMSLFERFAPKMHVLEEYPLTEKLAEEYKLLGLYISGHPLEMVYQKLPANFDRTDVNDLVVGMVNVNLAIYIEAIKEIRTKKGELMAFIDGMDLSGRLSITVFPNLYKQVAWLLKPNQTIMVQGKVEAQRDREGIQVIANQITKAEQLINQNKSQIVEKGRWFLKVQSMNNQETLMQIIKEHPGENAIVIVDAQTGKNMLLKKENWLASDGQTKAALVELLGAANVFYRPNNDLT
ncbi:DNA polymerase III subunit alpha [Weissella oryzae SG25]|uniref:DNA polymerase III subunit alpha n=1 Tax=Weissella oryzae (strain DSM 25784 / JCM 18191 / LMG 30913 / SG25) TaxID=1329250 RepID=A0A069CSG2_WEIOS|nr:DNA polymerase III subunit alpha [Weissella oryzae]GAK30409.1 DNA polymerase III subunit alpha [Weissella oryzae SG25]